MKSATVMHVEGQAWAVGDSGEKREVYPGDTLKDGERLIAPGWWWRSMRGEVKIRYTIEGSDQRPDGTGNGDRDSAVLTLDVAGNGYAVEVIGDVTNGSLVMSAARVVRTTGAGVLGTVLITAVVEDGSGNPPSSWVVSRFASSISMGLM